MRLKIVRDFVADQGDSVFGRLSFPGVTLPTQELLTCERGWAQNLAGKSCVPAGFYYLEPHNGTKYSNTFALIGASVSHVRERDVARYACVLHWASAGMYLEGCISIGKRIEVGPGVAVLHGPAVDDVLAVLAGRPSDEKHYLEITEAFPISTG